MGLDGSTKGGVWMSCIGVVISIFGGFFSLGVFFILVHGLGIGVLVVILLDYSGQRVLSWCLVVYS